MKIQEITLLNGMNFVLGRNKVIGIIKTFRSYKVIYSDADVLTVPKRNVLCIVEGILPRPEEQAPATVNDVLKHIDNIKEGQPEQSSQVSEEVKDHSH